MIANKISNILVVPVEGSLSNGIQLIFAKSKLGHHVNIRQLKYGKYTKTGVFLSSVDIDAFMNRTQEETPLSLINFKSDGIDKVRLIYKKTPEIVNFIDVTKKAYDEIIVPYFGHFLKLQSFNLSENTKMEIDCALALNIVEKLALNDLPSCCLTSFEDHLCTDKQYGTDMKYSMVRALDFFTGSGDVAGHSMIPSFPIYNMADDILFLNHFFQIELQDLPKKDRGNITTQMFYSMAFIGEIRKTNIYNLIKTLLK
jgi:hypothetical protein